MQHTLRIVILIDIYLATPRVPLLLHPYGVATISRLIKIIPFFGEDRSLLEGSFAKETYYLKVPTKRSHPILHPYLAFIQKSSS